MTTAQIIREQLANAPETAPANPALKGWWIGAGYFVCSSCAGRLMARGCKLPAPTEPVWIEPGMIFGDCCACA